MASAPSSFFSDRIGLPTEVPIIPYLLLGKVCMHMGAKEMQLVPRSKYFAALPMEKSRAIGFNSLESLESFHFIKDHKTKLGIDHHFMGAGRVVSLSMARWKATEQDSGPQSGLHVHPASLYVDGNKTSFQYKNALFPSSLSEVINGELRQSSSDSLCVKSTDMVNSNFEVDEPFESLKEIELQTVGNILPDEDELLSGIIDDIKYNFRPDSGIDAEHDLFCGGGGMELEADSLISNKGLDPVNDVNICHQEMLNGPFSGEHPHVEHPSRTLFVWNINSKVEDYEIRTIFEQYGDVSTLYTAFKHCGFVMVSYYDIRSACNAVKALQNKPLRQTKLDIHFSIPKDNPIEGDINQGALVVFNLDSSVSNDDLRQMFGIYGDIKEIRETPQRRHHKFIEFYDVRAAEAALCALNRSDIAGKRIKPGPSRPGAAGQCTMQQFSSDLELEEANVCCQKGSPSDNSSFREYGPISPGVITSYGYGSGSLQGANSTVCSPHCPIVNSQCGGISSNIPHSLSSPVRVASRGGHSSQYELIELSHSVGEMKSGLEYMPTPYSHHSLPESLDGVADGIPLNSPSTISAMATRINSSPVQSVDNMHIYRGGSCRPDSPSYDCNGAFGASGNGSCPLHGQQYVWNNSISHYRHPQGQIIWPDSPLFNNISASPVQLRGLPITPSRILNTVSPLHVHHLGSTPSANPSLWDRRHAYAADATNASESHPGSLGAMGFSGYSIHHLSELASPNIFPHIGGNVIDSSISSHVGLPPSPQRCHMFHGRTSTIPVPASFDANDCIRSRRSDANSTQADNKKQYELDIEQIIHGEDSRTTLMIKNIPNKYTSKMLLAAIDEHHRGTYDFIYLPIDFKNKCNVGYAFINMVHPQQIIPFFKTFNGKKWEKFNSEKVVSLAYARIQGKAALIAHFQNSSLMNEDKRCRPILFHTNGPNAGDQEPFPMGVNIRSRPNRQRTTSNENNHQQSSSTSTNGEESPNGTDSSSGSVKDLE